MAMIREKREFRISPIGVARSSSAGQITGEAIARNAAKAEAVAYKRAVQDAEKRGIDLANALSGEQVMALDPSTGLPEVHEGPKGLGRVAQQAYQNVLLTRFEQELGTQIDGKMKELALKYDLSPSGFNKAASEYIAQMANTETSTVFSNEIVRVGQAVKQGYAHNLSLKALTRERAEQVDAYNLRIQERQAALEIAARTGNTEQIQLILKQGAVDDQNMANSQLVTASSTKLNSKFDNVAIARGTLRSVIETGNFTHMELLEIQSAVDMGNLGGLSEEIKNALGKDFQDVLSDPSTFEQFTQYANEYMGDAVGASSIKVTKSIQEARVAANSGKNSNSNIMKSADATASGADPSSLVDEVVKAYKDSVTAQQGAVIAGMSNSESSDLMLGVTKRVNGVADGIQRHIVSQLTSKEEIVNVIQFLNNPNAQGLKGIPNNLRDDLEDLVLLDNKTGLGLKKSAITFFEGFKDEVAFKENKIKNDAGIQLYRDVNEAIDSTIRTGSDVDGVNTSYAETMSNIESSKADKEVIERQKASLNNAAATAYIRLAINSAATAEMAEAMAAYAKGIKPSISLPENVRDVLDKARRLGDESTLTTAANNKSQAKIKDLENRTALSEIDKLNSDIGRGMADASDKDNREHIDTVLKLKDDFYTVSSSEQDQGFKAVGQVVLPQSFVSLLDQAANGNVPTGMMNRLLSLYANTSTQIDRNGIESLSNSHSALDANTKAFWDLMSSYQQQSDTPINEAQFKQFADFYKETVRGEGFATVMGSQLAQYAAEETGGTATKNQTATPLQYLQSLTGPDENTPISAAIRNTKMTEMLEASVFAWFADRGGANKIDMPLKDYVTQKAEALYVEDKNVLPEFGETKTIYPLSATLSSDPKVQEMFLNAVRKDLHLMDKDFGWATKEFKLRPVGQNLDTGMTYGVMVKGDDGEFSLYEHSVDVMTYRGYDGDNITETFIVPAFISTKEEKYLKNIRALESYQEEAAVTRAEEMSRMEEARELYPARSVQLKEKISEIKDTIDINVFSSLTDEQREVFANLTDSNEQDLVGVTPTPEFAALYEAMQNHYDISNNKALGPSSSKLKVNEEFAKATQLFMLLSGQGVVPIKDVNRMLTGKFSSMDNTEAQLTGDAPEAEAPPEPQPIDLGPSMTIYNNPTNETYLIKIKGKIGTFRVDSESLSSIPRSQIENENVTIREDDGEDYKKRSSSYLKGVFK